MFEEVCGVTIPYEIVERREGDIVSMYANTDLARKELNWKTKYTLREMCKRLMSVFRDSNVSHG